MSLCSKGSKLNSRKFEVFANDTKNSFKDFLRSSSIVSVRLISFHQTHLVVTSWLQAKCVSWNLLEFPLVMTERNKKIMLTIKGNTLMSTFEWTATLINHKYCRAHSWCYFKKKKLRWMKIRYSKKFPHFLDWIKVCSWHWQEWRAGCLLCL